jgi:L-rhamnose mutarotase
MESNRHAWTWNIKPEKLDEYVKMHLDVWPEVRNETYESRNQELFDISEWKPVLLLFRVRRCEEGFRPTSTTAASARNGTRSQALWWKVLLISEMMSR